MVDRYGAFLRRHHLMEQRGECPICPKGSASIHPIAPARYSEIIFNESPPEAQPGG
jgi:hypothetical protein